MRTVIHPSKSTGLTILEVMLVLAIATSFVLMGIRQFQQFKTQASFLDVKQNVDILFQALGQYYQANCRSLSDASVAGTANLTGTTQQGDLAPGGVIKNYTKSNQTYPVDIQKKLVEGHFLSVNWPRYAAIVETDSYAATFIFMLTTKSTYACWNFKNAAGAVQCNTALYYPSDPAVGPQTIQDKQVAFWLVEVSVKVANDPDGTKTTALVGPTGASCASGSPDVCDGSKEPQYLIWQQLPTKTSSATNSDLWISQQQEATFNQQYTHDTMYEMSTSNYAPTGSEIDMNYLCGN